MELSLLYLQSDFVFICSSGDKKAAVALVDGVSSLERSSGLIAAASRGHIEICELLLEKDLETAKHADSNGWNALRSAACSNQVGVVKLLIQKGLLSHYKFINDSNIFF